LELEISFRLPATDTSAWQSALWVEPQQSSWPNTLDELSHQLPPNSRLAIILSLPTARFLPERRSWSTTSLAEHAGGLPSLVPALPQYGFSLQSIHGFHTAHSVLLSLLATLSLKLHRFAQADHLGFTAQKHYITPTSTAWFATCALVLVTRQ
jgi:hypothetical protein